MSRRRSVESLLGRVATRVGAELDGAVLSALTRRFQKKRRAEETARTPEHTRHHGDRRALLEEAIAFYGQFSDASERGEQFFPPLEVPAHRVVARTASERRGKLPDGGEVLDLKWESGWEPRWPAVAADYLGHEANRWGYARVLVHPQPAPAIVCIHGYSGGNFFVEERAFVARWLYGLGLNVGLAVLPFHGPRAAPGVSWPSVDVVRSNEGFGQAIRDLRWLRAWLQARGQRPELAVAGMSLGGYTASLWATVEPLDALLAFIPVASFGDLLWEHGAGTAAQARAAREGITREHLKAVFALHTPLLRRPRTDPSRIVVAASAGDRIAPVDQARALARHFGVNALELPGGHLLQLGRGTAFRALARTMAAHGLLAPRD